MQLSSCTDAVVGPACGRACVCACCKLQHHSWTASGTAGAAASTAAITPNPVCSSQVLHLRHGQREPLSLRLGPPSPKEGSNGGGAAAVNVCVCRYLLAVTLAAGQAGHTTLFDCCTRLMPARPELWRAVPGQVLARHMQLAAPRRAAPTYLMCCREPSMRSMFA